MNTDLRILKTKKAISTAFLELLTYMNFEDITITMICKKSEIRRATFYNHFQDKYELLAYCVRVTLKQFVDISDIKNLTYEDILLRFAKESISYLSDKVELILSLRKSNLMPLLYSIMFQEVKLELKEYEKQLQSDTGLKQNIKKGLLINYHFEGVLGAIKWWVEENQPISRDELISEVISIINNGFKGSLN